MTVKLPTTVLELIDSLPLIERQPTVDKLGLFTDYLIEVNRKINLVSRRETETVIADQIFDSLSMLPLINYRPGASLLDLGSGAGFPGLIHKVARPDLKLISVDAAGRKIEFQRSAAARLGLENCVFHVKRIEDLPPQGVEYLIAKAVSDVSHLANLAKPHLATAGVLLLPRAFESQSEDLVDSGLRLELNEVYTSSPAGRRSRLLIYRKSKL